MKENFTKYTAILFILLLGGFLALAMLPYINGVFGALILFVMFNPLYKRLNKKLNGTVSALIIIVFTVLIIVIPLIFLTSALVSEIQIIAFKAKDLVNEFQGLELIDQYVENVDLQNMIRSQISSAGSFFQGSLISALNKAAGFVVNLIITYFLLFYMFLNSNKLVELGYEFIPFSQTNSNRLMDEFSRVTKAVIISTGVIAIMQGVLVGAGLFVFGVPGAILWGVIGIILSFLPVVGVPVIWIPAGAYKLIVGEPWAAVGIFVWGLIISNVDSFIRPALQKKVGRMHPLISLIGVFIGLPFFGILGLVIGPLLLSYFFLSLRMFKEEYIRR